MGAHLDIDIISYWDFRLLRVDGPFQDTWTTSSDVHEKWGALEYGRYKLLPEGLGSWFRSATVAARTRGRVTNWAFMMREHSGHGHAHRLHDERIVESYTEIEREDILT